MPVTLLSLFDEDEKTKGLLFFFRRGRPLPSPCLREFPTCPPKTSNSVLMRATEC